MQEASVASMSKKVDIMTAFRKPRAFICSPSECLVAAIVSLAKLLRRQSRVSSLTSLRPLKTAAAVSGVDHAPRSALAKLRLRSGERSGWHDTI